MLNCLIFTFSCSYTGSKNKIMNKKRVAFNPEKKLFGNSSDESVNDIEKK